MTYTQTDVQELQERLPHLRKALHQQIVGQNEVLDQIIVSLVAGGHALLEGVPGLAKTLMVRSLAQALDLPFKRIQFTPDLMPGDLIGTEILEEDSSGKHHFRFEKGPLFANLILADEINRTPPKTQAALLEAMQEGSITWAGQTYQLAKPYFILATQNPVEQSGTFPLPEAQRDRFLMHIQVDYPNEEEEIQVLLQTTDNRTNKIEQVFGGEEILKLQQMCRDVIADEALVKQAARMVRATRPDSSSNEHIRQYVQWGAGPRAGQALLLAAKAHALLQGRLSITPDDLQWARLPVLRHRLVLHFNAQAEGIQVRDIISKL
jgi:MoxR-like ATPase